MEIQLYQPAPTEPKRKEKKRFSLQDKKKYNN
jgi:hypothetical protein